HYGNLAMAFLGSAILRGLDTSLTSKEQIADQPRSPGVWIEGDPTHRAILHHGPYSAHVNAFPSPRYDGFGVVDLTFGPDRFLQFATSVHHLSTPNTHLNLGMALRDGPGRSKVQPIATSDLTLIGEIEQ